jgi:hypothetical protein
MIGSNELSNFYTFIPTVGLLLLKADFLVKTDLVS